MFRARAVDFRTAGPVPASPRSNRSGGLFEEFFSHRWIKSEEKEFFSRRRRWIKSGALLSLRILYIINRSMQAPKTPITRWMIEQAVHTHLSTGYLPVLVRLQKVKQAHVPIHTTTGTHFFYFSISFSSKNYIYILLGDIKPFLVLELDLVTPRYYLHSRIFVVR